MRATSTAGCLKLVHSVQLQLLSYGMANRVMSPLTIQHMLLPLLLTNYACVLFSLPYFSLPLPLTPPPSFLQVLVPRVCVTCSPRRAARPHPSSSSMRLMPLDAHAAGEPWQVRGHGVVV